jgi:integrase
VKLIKKCRHGRGLTGEPRERAWRECACAWLIAAWDTDARRWRYENVGADLQRARVAFRDRGNPQSGGHLRGVAERYIDALRVNGRHPRTLDQYRVYQRRAEEWFGVTFAVAEIDTRRLEEFRAAMIASGRDPGYAKSAVWFVRALVRHGLREGLPGISGVPDLAPPVMPKRGRRSDRISLPEAEKLVAALRPPWRTAGELILLTGLRIGELMALTPEAVDLSGGVLKVEVKLERDGSTGPPKTETSARSIRLSPRASALLAARLLEARPGERIFPGQMEGMARRAIRDALRDADLAAPGRGWHLLRHAHRDLLEAAHVSVRAAGARLGHGHTFAMTETYGWAAEAEDVSAIDLVRSRHGVPPSSG